MISKLFNQEKLSKSDRKEFVPFVNERNFMGCLISDMPKTTFRYQRGVLKKDQEIIENINKTTKEHLFEKKYNKMIRKWQNIEDSM